VKIIFDNHALLTLKYEKDKLKQKQNSIENDDGTWHVLNPKKELTRIKHQLNDLDFAIEVLEEYQD